MKLRRRVLVIQISDGRNDIGAWCINNQYKAQALYFEEESKMMIWIIDEIW